MGFQDDPNVIQWHLHLNRPPHEVYEMLSTDDGRAQFWAEEAIETRGVIGFLFPNGARWRGEILEEMSPHWFSVRYYGGSTATFTLKEDGSGGTDLALTDQGVDPEHRFVNGSPVRDSGMPVCARICAASGPTTWWPGCCRCRWGRSSGWPTYHL